MALIGDVGFDGLLVDFTQVFDVVCQALDHTGLPYGSWQLLVCCCVIWPTYPVWHEITLVCVDGKQVGGAGLQLSLSLYQPESLVPEVVHVLVRFHVSPPT
jgi:hypothetical protein